MCQKSWFVAKATAQKLTERTMFTEFGQVRDAATVEMLTNRASKRLG